MRKATIILITMILFIFAGCSSKEVIKHNYIYKGENEFWTAEYKVNAIRAFIEKGGKTDYESNSNTILTITYKKDLSELSSVKHLEISYKSSAGSGKLNLNFDDNPPNEKTYTLKSSSKGRAIEIEDEIVKVNINIEGETQIIKLKNV